MRGSAAKETRRESAMVRRINDAIKWDQKAKDQKDEAKAKAFKKKADIARKEVENIKNK